MESFMSSNGEGLLVQSYVMILVPSSGGGARWYDHYLDALSMEAMACRDGLLMARQVGAQRVWLETDCQELVKLWRAGDSQRSSVLPILREIRDLSLLFQEFNFSFISRKCNMVAHTLAKQVLSETQVGGGI
jgi:ribonuclease HI